MIAIAPIGGVLAQRGAASVAASNVAAIAGALAALAAVAAIAFLYEGAHTKSPAQA